MTSLLAALTIKVSVILLLALTCTRGLRRSSASARHWVLAVAVVSALVMPALHVLPMHTLRLRLSSPFTGQHDVGLLGSAGGSQPAGAGVDRFRSAVATLASDEMVGRLAVTIWLLGVVASAVVFLAGLARLRRLRVSADRLRDGPWSHLCSDLAQSCGLKRGVDLLLGPRPELMATWGWRRPVIMLPASASKWPEERMRVVLLHEIAHVRRADWMLQMAAEGLRCLWWFNPLTRIVCRRIRRESEHAADDVVLSQGVKPATYATHLVDLAREVREGRQMWLPAPALARRSHLRRRLSVLLSSRTNRRPITRLARVGSLSVVVLSSLLIANLHVGPVSAAGLSESIRGTGEQPRVTEPIRIGEGVRPPTRIHTVAPVYPPEAVTTRVQGVVGLEALIGSNGEVTDVAIVRSVPPLDDAAAAALRQWRYEPMHVDGVPVSFVMTVNIHFTLPPR